MKAAISSAVTVLAITWIAAPAAAQNLFDDAIGTETSSDPFGSEGDSGELTTDGAFDPQAEFQRASQQADELMKGGKWEEAIVEFNKVLALDRTYAPAHFGLGQCFTELGSIDDAIGAYSRAIISPTATRFVGLVPQAYLERGKLYADSSRFREAVDDFTQSIAQNPSNADAYFQQGRALLRLVLSQGGVVDQSGQQSLLMAVDALERAISKQPGFGEAHLERGRVLARLGELDFAIEDLEAAVRILGPASQASADLGITYSQRANGESASADGDSQVIVSDLRAAIGAMDGFLSGATLGVRPKPWESVDPTEMRPETVLLSRAESRIALANELSGDGRRPLYQSAIQDAQTILDSDDNPLNQARAYFSQGHAHRMMGDLDAAIDAYTRATNVFPSYTEAFLRRGICLFHLKKYDQALQDFAASSTDPRTLQFEARAMFWAGLTHAHMGAHQQAIRDYTRAIRVAPEYLPAYLNRGLAYLNVGRPETATRDFNNVLRRDRGNADAQRYLQIAKDRRDASAVTSR